MFRVNQDMTYIATTEQIVDFRDQTVGSCDVENCPLLDNVRMVRKLRTRQESSFSTPLPPSHCAQ